MSTTIALVVAARFGLLFGLALWVGLTAAARLTLPIIDSDGEGHRHLADVVAARLHGALFLAAALVVTALGARTILNRAAPPSDLLVVVAAMMAMRLVAVAGRGSRPTTSSRRLALNAEIALALYALYAVS